MTVTLTLPPAVEGAIQEAARRQGQTPEEAIAQALHTLFVSTAGPSSEEDAVAAEAQEHQRIQTLFAQLRREAQGLAGDRKASRAAAESDPVSEAVAEKFRRQGFHL